MSSHSRLDKPRKKNGHKRSRTSIPEMTHSNRPQTANNNTGELKNRLRECEDTMKDLKKLVELNKEAMMICAQGDTKAAIEPLLQENRVLLESLLRNFSFQEKLGLLVST